MVYQIQPTPHYPNSALQAHQGVGMTSQRTRNRLINRLVEKGVANPQLLEVMQVVPRHLFLDEALASRAYEDTALPIGYGQTISQPWVVATMTEWLLGGNYPVNKVLEIGTGSGYQTAILSLLVEEVVSVERIEPLTIKAQSVLRKLGLNNVHFHLSDGHWGWEQAAPYDAIISAASPEQVPQSLLKQLKIGARLVMPIGSTTQLLYGFEKLTNGEVEQTCLGEVMFVPMKQGVEA